MNVFGVSFFMRVMYRENMSGFDITTINLDEEIAKVAEYGTINDIDESEETNTGPSPGQIAKNLALIKYNRKRLLDDESNPMIVYTPESGPAITFKTDSIPDGEKLIIRIMGDLYKFSAKHAHVVASFIFAVGLYKVGTDIKPLLVKFVSFLKDISPRGNQMVSATKFAFYATTAFSSVLFWMGYDKKSIQSELLDKVNSNYKFKNVGLDDVIYNHTIIDDITKKINMGIVIKDFYGALACISKICTNSIPTLVCDTTNRLCSMVSSKVTNTQTFINDMQHTITTIFNNYLESNDYSEDDKSTVSSFLSQESTKSILSELSIISIIQTDESDPSDAINKIVEENDKIVEENVETVATQDFTDVEVILDKRYEPLSQLSDEFNDEFNEVEYKSDSDDENIQDNKYENVGGKSRRKHNKKTHKKRNKKTHKKQNKKTHKKKSRKQRRSRKH